MQYINCIKSYLNAYTRKQTSRFPVSKQPTRMPNLIYIYIVTSSYNSQPCCFGIPIHPPPTAPGTPRHPPNPTSLSTLTGGVISAFVVEYYYFRERTREGLKDRQHKIEGEETKTKNRHLKWGWVSADFEFGFNWAAHSNMRNVGELHTNSGITKILRSHKIGSGLVYFLSKYRISTFLICVALYSQGEAVPCMPWQHMCNPNSS